MEVLENVSHKRKDTDGGKDMMTLHFSKGKLGKME